MEAVRVSTFHPQTKTNSEDEFSKQIPRRRMAPWRRFNPRRRIPWGRISARRRITPPKTNSVCKETVLSTLCCTHPSSHLRWVPHEVFFSSVRFASWGACGENSVAPRAWTFTGCGTMDFQKPSSEVSLHEHWRWWLLGPRPRPVTWYYTNYICCKWCWVLWSSTPPKWINWIYFFLLLASIC